MLDGSVGILLGRLWIHWLLLVFAHGRILRLVIDNILGARLVCCLSRERRMRQPVFLHLLRGHLSSLLVVGLPPLAL